MSARAQLAAEPGELTAAQALFTASTGRYVALVCNVTGLRRVVVTAIEVDASDRADPAGFTFQCDGRTEEARDRMATRLRAKAVAWLAVGAVSA